MQTIKLVVTKHVENIQAMTETSIFEIFEKNTKRSLRINKNKTKIVCSTGIL